MPMSNHHKPALTRKYFLLPSSREEWIITGEHGSVSFWYEKSPLDHMKYGGIEFHYSKCPDYMTDQPASHKNCHANGGPCWHDGSSLQAIEEWIPNILPLGDDCIWSKLEQLYKKELEERAEEESKC